MEKRLDIRLVEMGKAESREKAQLAIKKHLVKVNGKVATKPALAVKPEDEVELIAPPLPYVSRGGVKLEKAIREFLLDFRDARVLDIGASTGGFTDCALQHGASMVYAVDVGSSQLHPSLTNCPKVKALENLDIRNLTLTLLDGQAVDWAVADVSFISLQYILPVIPAFLRPGSQLVLLIKPQFELGQKISTRGGIVKDGLLKQKALQGVLEAAKNHGFIEKGITSTEVEDPKKKNQEFLCWLVFSG